MKDILSAFYNDESDTNLEKIWKNEKTKFVFDTNILLNIYYYNSDGKKIFFQLLKSLGNRAWLPFHVALEYQRNRLKIINECYESNQKIIKRIESLSTKIDFDETSFDKIQENFKDFFNKNNGLHDKFKEFKDSYKNILSESQTKFKDISKPILDEIKRINSDQISINSHDHVRDRLDNIFKEDRLGVCLFKDESDLNTFNKDAEKRFSNQLPPGYADEKEKGEDFFMFQNYKYFNKFGDLIVFKEIIKHAKDNELENIVFISEEKKEDWRECIQTSNQKKVLGIRHELKDELYREAKVKNIFIFNQEQFVSYTNKFLATNLDQESINRMNKTIERVNSRVINRNFLRDVDVAPGLEELELAAINPLGALSEMNIHLKTEIKKLESYIEKIKEDINETDLKYYNCKTNYHSLLHEDENLVNKTSRLEREYKIEKLHNQLNELSEKKKMLFKKYLNLLHKLKLLEERSQDLISEIDQNLNT
ncbi:PIN-like domain-containing protein [Acinetobacter baumannii]|uniref:PIN-like domain-containing protein n=1 Tax=Acinetobacter baumannii TaxID=470 RepID=UPI003892BB6C